MFSYCHNSNNVMNRLAVISKAGLRKAEFYGDFIELCPGARWQSLGGEKVFSGRIEQGTNVYGVFPVYQVIYPSGKQHECCLMVRKAEGLSDLPMDSQLLGDRTWQTAKPVFFPRQRMPPRNQWHILVGLALRDLSHVSPVFSDFL